MEADDQGVHPPGRQNFSFEDLVLVMKLTVTNIYQLSVLWLYSERTNKNSKGRRERERRKAVGSQAVTIEKRKKIILEFTDILAGFCIQQQSFSSSSSNCCLKHDSNCWKKKNCVVEKKNSKRQAIENMEASAKARLRVNLYEFEGHKLTTSGLKFQIE